MKTLNVKVLTKKLTGLNKLISNNSVELENTDALDKLTEKIGDAEYVLLGEASHGTHEYYKWRIHLSRKLIEKKGFSFIAVEGDWQDCYLLNRYIKNYSGSGKDALKVLHSFNHWPAWMWANWEIVALAEWMRNFNKDLPFNRKAGFYGLDVYSLWESLETIIKYLDKKDLKTQKTSITAQKCFEPYIDEEGQSYARTTAMVPESYESEVIEMLTGIRQNMTCYNSDHEAVLSAEQNAYVMLNAEKYYRAMIRPGPESWNIRDSHMFDTLNRLKKFHGKNSKAIIWEHNTHIGDARATDMPDEGMINLGQLVNQMHKNYEVFTIGFGTFTGSVIAGRKWGDDMQVMKVPKAIPGSWEYILHQLDGKDRIIFMGDEMKKEIGRRRFEHRAIGVVYNPEFERTENYVPSIMPYRYDAFIFLDESSALHPLHIKPDGNQMPELFPFGV